MTELRYKDRRLEGDTPLRQCQLASLHLLHVLDRVCEENGLCYWIAYGTLLGAVRHKGFIPWDDDVDVCMTLPDLKKLSRIADKAFPKDVIWQDPWRFPKSDCWFGRLRDAYSTIMQRTAYKHRCVNDPQGVPLDIFPILDVHDNALMRILQKIRGPLEWRSRFAGCVGPVTLLGLVKKWLLKAAYLLAALCWNAARCVCQYGERAYVMVNGVNEDKTRFMPYTAMRDRIKMRFEDGEFWAPHDAVTVVRRCYSDDYMVPVRTQAKEEGVYLPTTPNPHSRAMKYQ